MIPSAKRRDRLRTVLLGLLATGLALPVMAAMAADFAPGSDACRAYAVQRSVELAALELELLLADVDHHRADVLVRERAAPRGHFLVGVAALDALREALVVAAVHPDVIQHRGRLRAFHFLAVTVGAELFVALGDGAGPELLRVQARRREGERAEGAQEGVGGGHGKSGRQAVRGEGRQALNHCLCRPPCLQSCFICASTTASSWSTGMRMP